MVKLFAASAALLLATATAASVPDGKWPTSAGSVRLAAAQVVKAGEVFDGKMQTYERSDVSCEGQTESGADTAVFKLEPGATLKNVIIGKNQMEGVHCDKHDCTIENVWWDDVCEDALSVKGGSASSVTTVTGGGARSADDKVIQHNGLGTVKIDGFYGEDVGKLYRSCGTCGGKARKGSMSNVLVVNPTNAVVTVNKNWGDQATLSNIWVKSSGSKKVKICQWSQGNANGEPSMLGDGPSPSLCQYSESDVHINGNVAKAGGTSGSPVQQSSLRGSKAGGDNPLQDDGNNDNKGQSGESKKSKSGGDKKKKDDGNNEKQDDGNNEKQESKGNSSSSNKKNDGKGNKKQGDNDDDKKQSNNSKGDKKNEGKSDKQNEGKGDKKKNDDDDN